MTAPNAPGGLKLTHPERLHAFVKWVMLEGCWNGSDLDGGQLQEKALEFDLLIKEPYDPEVHGESEFDIDTGDDWYRLAPLRAEHDAKDADIARLKEDNAAAKRMWGEACGALARAEARLAALATVTEADVDVALKARVPGGAQVYWWLPQVDGDKPHPTVGNVIRAALEAFVANKLKGGGATSTESTTNEAQVNGASTPAPQSPDQPCGAESDATFVERLASRDLIRFQVERDRLIALARLGASRPAPVDAVRVLVEALGQMIKYARWQYKEGGSHHPTLGSAIAAANDALSDPRVIAAQSADPWLPIASAPKDGSWVMVFASPRATIPAIVKWVEGEWHNELSGHLPFGFTIDFEPTHWAFLPAAPARQQGEPS